MEEEEGINFHKLEKEFTLAVEADAKYERVNAAKFRAVEQRVGSYEEFKDIVAASHLKPLEKKDRLGQEKPKQPWNSLATTPSKSEKSNSMSSSGQSRPSQQPLTSHIFIKTWKNELKTAQDKYRYLCKTGGASLGKIFKSEIPMSLFGELIEVLTKGFCLQDCDTVLDILWYLSSTSRFSLTVDFLSSKEKSCVKELFEKLKACLTDECPRTVEDKDNFQELLKVYNVDL